MSEKPTPIYIESYDLACWVLDRIEAWPQERGRSLDRQLSEAVCDLLNTVSLALTFPQRRSQHLVEADESIVRVRMLLRLARHLGLISPGGERQAQSRLLTIGRMLGGWQRQLRGYEKHPPNPLSDPSSTNPFQGTGSPATTA